MYGGERQEVVLQRDADRIVHSQPRCISIEELDSLTEHTSKRSTTNQLPYQQDWLLLCRHNWLLIRYLEGGCRV